MVTTEQLRSLYYAEPFKPFVIHRKDGTKTLIKDSSMFMIAPAPRQVAYRRGTATTIASFADVSIEPVGKKKATTVRRKKVS